MVRTTTGNLIGNTTGNSPDGNAEVYNGTVTVNGTGSVTVVAAGYTLGDIVQFGLLTVGGTVGALPTVKTGTTGTGFTVAATASDTSVYNYIGFKPAAQQNS